MTDPNQELVELLREALTSKTWTHCTIAVKRALSLAERNAEANRWIPIDYDDPSTLPQLRVFVLVATVDRVVQRESWRWTGSQWEAWSVYGAVATAETGAFTHWRLLPPPPEPER